MSDQASATSVPRHGPPVSWFELFYDLVVVAAVTLANDAYLRDPSIETARAAALGLLALSWVWLVTTLLNNVLPDRGLVRRMILLIQMAAIITSALALDDDSAAAASVAMLAYAGALGTIVAILLADRLMFGQRHATAMLRTTLIPLAAAIVICIAGAFAPEGLVFWFLLAALIVSMVPLLGWQYRHWQGLTLLRLDHLRERLGLFVLIILGEGFAQLVATLQEVDGIPRTWLYALVFLVSFALWWIYFEGTFGEDVELVTVRWRLSLLAHLMLVFGIAGTLDILVLLTAQVEGDYGPLVIEYFSLSIGTVLLSFALLRFTSKGRLGIPGALHIISGILIIGVGLLLGEAGGRALNSVIISSVVLVIVNGSVAAWVDRSGVGTARERFVTMMRGT